MADDVVKKASDASGEIDLNPALALERIDSWLDGFIKLLPNIAVALILFGLFFIVAKVVRSVVHRTFKSRGRSNLGEVLGGLLSRALILLTLSRVLVSVPLQLALPLKTSYKIGLQVC